MITTTKLTTVVLLAGVAAGCVAPIKSTVAGEPTLSARDRRRLADEVSGGWSPTPRLAARRLLARYGAPDEVGSSRLVWHGNGRWKRTVVRDLPMPYASADGEDLGVIEQTVAYRANAERAEALGGLGDRVQLDRARMELSSRSDREEVNCLRLNLANDVAEGAMTPEEAAAYFVRALALEASGKTQPYMQGLRFGPAP